jgi:putative transposase
LARTKREIKPLETIWEVPDRLWQRIEPILREDAPSPPKAHGGRPRIDWRAAFDGIIFRLRTGCRWNQRPKRFGDDSSVHRRSQRWCKNGVFERVWAVPVEECDDLGAVDWRWQAADGMRGEARFGGKRRARPPPTGASRGPRRACWSRATVARWGR